MTNFCSEWIICDQNLNYLICSLQKEDLQKSSCIPFLSEVLTILWFPNGTFKQSVHKTQYFIVELEKSKYYFTKMCDFFNKLSLLIFNFLLLYFSLKKIKPRINTCI
jgi:hypothetical protein